MLPFWLIVLVVIFLAIALARPRPGRYPHVQAILAVVVVLAYEGIHSHLL